jgi:ABC-type transport system involved in multi-copper enzyme maturation permease subunit
MSAVGFAPAPTLGRLTSVELRKMADTRAGLWTLVATGLLAAVAVVITLAAGPLGERTLAGCFHAAVIATSTLLPVVGILAMTSEWSQRTALTTFALVPQRERVIFAKLLAALALALIAALMCLLAAVIATPFGAGASGGFTLSLLGKATLYQLIGMAAALGFGLAFMRPAPAIAVFFLAPTALSLLAQAMPGFAHTAIWLNLSDSAIRLTDRQLEMTGEAWAQIATGVVLWVVLPLAFGFARLKRRELA